MPQAWQSLFNSRKFWLAVYGLVQSVVLFYLEIPTDILVAADILVMAVIVGVFVEDAAAKRAGIQPQATAARSTSIETLPLGGQLTRQFPDELSANGFVRSVTEFSDQSGMKFAIIGPRKRWWSSWRSVTVIRYA